jgi:hypothetical protein
MKNFRLVPFLLLCALIPAAMADDLTVSRKTRARVSRVSLKTRKPLLGQPDAWEQQMVAEFDRLLDDGDTISRRLFSLPDDTLISHGHDYAGRQVSAIAEPANPRGGAGS